MLEGLDIAARGSGVVRVIVILINMLLEKHRVEQRQDNLKYNSEVLQIQKRTVFETRFIVHFQVNIAGKTFCSSEWNPFLVYGNLW